MLPRAQRLSEPGPDTGSGQITGTRILSAVLHHNGEFASHKIELRTVRLDDLDPRLLMNFPTAFRFGPVGRQIWVILKRLSKRMFGPYRGKASKAPKKRRLVLAQKSLK
jgi:hypothetical protein